MIYVHVPFCRSFCTYCGFYSELCGRNVPQHVQNRLFEAYTDALCSEIYARRDELSTLVPTSGAALQKTSGTACEDGTLLSPHTLYFGGGTPSILPIALVSRIVDAIGYADYEEFTVEVNPDDIVTRGLSYVKELSGLGVNRISMGVQSFDDGILRWMGRRHDADAAFRAFGILRESGMDNISIDLIFGLPQLSDELWASTIDKSLELRPEHISAYQLSVEEGSALEDMLSDGRFAEASEEQCKHQYDILCRRLAAAGYLHYEISNWALPGKEAVHNSAYWRRVPYVGIGPGAHSLTGNDVRSWNSCEMARYLPDGSLHTWSAESELLSRKEIDEESVMLSLRTAGGIPCLKLEELAGPGAIGRLLSEGSLSLLPDGNVRIPEDRFFVSDSIISSLF